MTTIKSATGHDWTPTRPREPAPPQREPGATLLHPWKCKGCGAYAEVAKGQDPFGSPAFYTSVPLPGARELERWGVAKDCEQQTVDEVHDL
jgi:hypothetical protein